MKNLIAILITALIVAVVSSCTSRSGELSKKPYEKVVIIDYLKMTEAGYSYKVKRIEKGVVDVVFSYYKFEKGDTILHRFTNN